MTNSRAATKLTDDVTAIFVRELEAGHTATMACDLAGVHRDTFHGWCQRGERGLEPYAAFLLSIRAARAKACGVAIDRINAAGESSMCPTCQCENRCVAPGDWKAIAWTAERLYPDTLQLTQKHEVQVRQGVEQGLAAILAATRDDGTRIVSEEAYGQFVEALERVTGVGAETAGADVVDRKRLGSGD